MEYILGTPLYKTVSALYDDDLLCLLASRMI